ncbi:NAD-P-binding protein [Mycena vulgaris]|nr:NAD-P-binding protein [Mycena vulgaris]
MKGTIIRSCIRIRVLTLPHSGRVIIADLNGEGGYVTLMAQPSPNQCCYLGQGRYHRLGGTAFQVDHSIEHSAIHAPVFANAGIAEHPWLPPFDPATAASRPLVKPDLATADINLTGQLYTAALALQTFERQEIGPTGFRGKLILTASVFGYFPSKAMPLYAASKAGIINFMRSAAQYYAEKNITVNSVAPNLVDTPIAPDVLFIPFRERKLLSDMQLVLEQFEKFLGESTLNGQALSISQENVWVHPADTHMLKENSPACDLISVELFKLFGDSTK